MLVLDVAIAKVESMRSLIFILSLTTLTILTTLNTLSILPTLEGSLWVEQASCLFPVPRSAVPYLYRWCVTGRTIPTLVGALLNQGMNARTSGFGQAP
ncbi:MAG: hypothetical protein F6K65_38425 [Moorea sp. SIO3C2]|nr:hypothetical protein [Moorena sp. SIO3C2]